MKRWTLTICLLLGCGDDGAAPDAGAGDVDRTPTQSVPDAMPLPELPWPEAPALADAGPYVVELGVPADDTGNAFDPLEPGGVIPIGGRGQAGLTAKLAVRVGVPPGDDAGTDAGNTDLDAALVMITLSNVASGVTGDSRAPDEPRALSCDDDGCVHQPIEVEITHLAKLPELEGLRVQVDLAVHDADDPARLLGRDRLRAVLRSF